MSNKPDRHISKTAQVGPDREPVPPEELKRIAKGMHDGTVFSNLHLPDDDRWIPHFMPMALADRDMIEAVLAVVDPEGHHDDPDHDHADLDESRDVGLIYEWTEKAMPMAMDGLPVFSSCRLLSPSETKTVLDMVDRLFQAEQKVLDGDGD